MTASSEALDPKNFLPKPAEKKKIIRLPENQSSEDWIVDEVPIALVYNGISHVVMMGTPQDLEDFAIGFSLSEGIISRPEQIYSIEVLPACGKGVEVQIEISPECFWKLKDYRRSMAGRTGCGICGTESLDNVSKKVNPLPFTKKFDLKNYHSAFDALNEVQKIGLKTGSTHAVCALDKDGRLLGGAEDVGRHVAMDKVIGKIAGNKWDVCALLMSSRASFEMVQKAAVFGIEILFAVSAPTLKAIELAEEAHITLLGFCRKNKANIYSHPERLENNIPSHQNHG